MNDATATLMQTIKDTYGNPTFTDDGSWQWIHDKYRITIFYKENRALISDGCNVHTDMSIIDIARISMPLILDWFTYNFLQEGDA